MGIWILFSPTNQRVFITPPIPKTPDEVIDKTLAMLGYHSSTSTYALHVNANDPPLAPDIDVPALANELDEDHILVIDESDMSELILLPRITPETTIFSLLGGSDYESAIPILENEDIDKCGTLAEIEDDEWNMLIEAGLPEGAKNYLMQRVELMQNDTSPFLERSVTFEQDEVADLEEVSVIFAPTDTTFIISPIPTNVGLLKIAVHELLEDESLSPSDIDIYRNRTDFLHNGSCLANKQVCTQAIVENGGALIAIPASHVMDETAQKRLIAAMRHVIRRSTSMTTKPPVASPPMSDTTKAKLGRGLRRASSIARLQSALKSLSSCAAFHKRYELGEKLGQGQFAIVHKCQHRATGEQFAVKVIQKCFLTRLPSLSLLYDEVAIWKSISHPHVVRVISVFEDSKELMIVLELAEGGELFERITELGFYTERDAIECIRNISSALRHLHARNIVHRDLKPENIMLASSSHTDIKICDFGLSRIVDDKAFVIEACGTPAFMAPEVVCLSLDRAPDDSPLDWSKADMWSVGVITFMLLAGYLPFASDDVNQLLLSIVEHKIEFRDDVWEKITANGRDFVSKLLCEDPAKRLSAEEALQHKWLQEKPHFPNRQLRSTLGNLRAYANRRKMMRVANTVIAAKRLQRAVSEGQILRHKPSEDDLKGVYHVESHTDVRERDIDV